MNRYLTWHKEAWVDWPPDFVERWGASLLLCLLAWSGGSKRPHFIKTLDELDLGLPVQYLTKGKTCYLRCYFLDWFRFLKNWSCKLPFSQSFPKETLRFAQVAADSDLVCPRLWDDWFGSPGVGFSGWAGRSVGRGVNLFSKASCHASLHSLHTFLSSKECSSVKCWGLLG